MNVMVNSNIENNERPYCRIQIF